MSRQGVMKKQRDLMCSIKQMSEKYIPADLLKASYKKTPGISVPCDTILDTSQPAIKTTTKEGKDGQPSLAARRAVSI